MAWGARMAMPTERAILTLAQWFSPAYPVGAFSFSHGLEAAALEGKIPDVDALENWLTALLLQGSGRQDVILLAAAFHAADNAETYAVNALAEALAPAKERLLETRSQGAAFAQITAAVLGVQLDGYCYPVAVGRAANLAEMPLALCSQMYLQALIGNLVSSAIRLGCCGQTDGQKLVSALSDLCVSVANTAIRQGLAELGSGCIALDIAAMKHETLYSRIFRS